MSECTNQKLGDMLHAYELGTLDESVLEEFEIHIIECAHCRNELERFESGASLIRVDPEFRHLTVKTLVKRQEKKGFLAKLKTYLWPDVPILFKPAVGLLAIVLLSWPAYLGLTMRGIPGMAEEIGPGGRIVHLTTMRGLAIKSFSSSETVIVDIATLFGMVAGSDGTYVLEIVTSENDSVHYRYNRWVFVKGSHKSLNIPPRSLPPGRYQLRLADPSGAKEFTPKEFIVR